MSPLLADLLRQRMTERTLARLWRETVAGCWLECADGRRLRVIYPGRPAVEGGPDFRDALLVTAQGRTLRGDVELHVRADGWLKHGHQRDPRFNSTVLHAVLWLDRPTVQGGGRTWLQAGWSVPVASLFPLLQRLRPERQAGVKREEVLEEGFGEPFLSRKGSPALPKERSLEKAGDERFQGKAKRSAERLRAVGPDQAFYEGLMEAMGYHQNRAPFLTLAAGLPYALLRRTAAPVAQEERRRALQELLLGASGLPGNGTGSWWPALEMAPVVGEGAWTLFRCRPSNHPRRRLLGMAGLLDRYWLLGPARSLVEAVMASDRVGALRSALTVAAPKGDAGGAFIGPQRAGEAAVNVVLPLCAAWGVLSGEGALKRRALALYHAWPALEPNHLTTEGTAVLGPETPARGLSACGQQGLLHLYREALRRGGPSLSSWLG